MCCLHWRVIGAATTLQRYSCTYEFLYDNNFKLNFHKDCKKIDSIILNYYDRKIKLLNLETIFLDDDKKIFSIEGDFFEYDLR